MAKKGETLFKERFRKKLDKLPHCWCFKVQLIALRGIPDIIMCLNGHFIALELKVDDDEPSRLQGWVIQKIIKAGGLALPVTPKTEEKVLLLLWKIAIGKAVYRPDPSRVLPEELI